MSNVISMRDVEDSKAIARRHTDTVLRDAMLLADPESLKAAMAQAKVLEAILTGDLWGGELFDTGPSGGSNIRDLAACAFLSLDIEMISDLMAEASLDGALCINRVISIGMPVAERIAQGGKP